jgi:hypothetical protein
MESHARQVDHVRLYISVLLVWSQQNRTNPHTLLLQASELVPARTM